jgi:hypothetical protein
MSLFELLSELSLLAGLGRSNLSDFFALNPEVNSIAQAINQLISRDVEVPGYLRNSVTRFSFEDALKHDSKQEALLLGESKEFGCSLELFGISFSPVRTE